MANSNTLDDIIPQLLVQGLEVLREAAIMPRYVNRKYESQPGEQYSSIDIPISSAITANAVVPGPTPPDISGSVPTKINIPVDQWFDAAFFMDDKDMLEAMKGHIPLQAAEAVKSLANKVDLSLLALYVELYAQSGTPGTTPFQTDLSEFAESRKLLKNQLAPPNDRTYIMNAEAEEKAILLRAFQDASYRGDTSGLLEGEIGRKLGAMWLVDQNIDAGALHTAGTGTGILAAALGVIGNKTLAIDTGSGTAKIGDIVTFADHTQQYTLTADSADVSTGTLAFEPGLVTAVPDTTAATIAGAGTTYQITIHMQRDCFSLVTRPFSGADPGNVGNFMSAVDPVSGLALRLEVTREHKRTTYAYDILWGVKCTRPQFGARVAGE